MTAQQKRKGHIRAFFAHYTDERLAMLLAHAQDGKLAYDSCCCFVGIAAWPGDHALALYGERAGELDRCHSRTGLYFSGGKEAEKAYCELACVGSFPEVNDTARRRILIPIIRAEMKRRAALRAQPWLPHDPIELHLPQVPVREDALETIA